MFIEIITPSNPAQWSGNRVTAGRWARVLKDLGHRIGVKGAYNGRSCDLLIALHAHRSANAVLSFRRDHPHVPVVVCLTGTDLYRDIRTSRSARRVLELATRLIVLQPLGVEELPGHLWDKTRVILQSVKRREAAPRPGSDTFDVCVIGNLRPIKDPLRTAMASRLVPVSSRLRVLHLGKALNESLARRARAETARNPRYQWLGEISPARKDRILVRSRALILSSKLEGGANVVPEALTASVPVLASDIPGSVGLLGENYPGYYPYGDTRALARLLTRLESEPAFGRRLAAACGKLAPLFEPERETAAWKDLLKELNLS
ncbi:MAG: selenoneine biosynthesis selenosugar synthase SenB [Nitrospinota bacterium]|jgi:putative glycosyltransferase (TIGR04348 family)|nr:selenoneine biosynthesis selenosugar synthase SenB [Nitrospinota bacterium]MDP6619316.1 selenoneine biosynthesis selenosugar synthase SenB [Nitrospinota bacterium]HJM44172.1 selenoneine biosynthesis selenosugar synthase SenB [Nitrospinota bacterium]